MGDTSNLAFTESEFRGMLATVVDEEHLGSLDFLLMTYPDLAAAVLVAGPDGALGLGGLRAVGEACDRVWHANRNGDLGGARAAADTPGAAGIWSQHVACLQHKSDETGFVNLRLKFLDKLAEGQPRAALELDLVGAAERLGSVPARVEAGRLEASAHLVSDDIDQCITVLQKTLVIAESLPLQAASLQLLLGEAFRHARQKEAWRDAWIQATSLESGVSRTAGLWDPVFWTKAAYLRPASQPWPDQVILDFHSILDQHGIVFPNAIADESQREAIVWAVVGVQSLRRHESQSALLAFKKAEALASDPALRSQLLLHQAMTMLDGGQAGPASPLLLRLASEKGIVADRARAVLGSLKLQHGSTAQGMNLLRSAMSSINEWPLEEQLRAKSDLALGYLIEGDEKRGLPLQDEMCEAFLEANLHNHAVQCLVNQAQYFETTRQANRRQATLDRLASIRRQIR
jgi:hypothetical protein